MSLDLNKLANKLDEALSNETSETLTKFLTDKRMSNNKQTSVEQLFHKLWDEPKDKFTWYVMLKEHMAMHKEEIERAHYEGSVIVISKPDDDMLQLSQQYYNETYLEAPKVILETTTTNTAKGYWVKHLKTFGGNNK